VKDLGVWESSQLAGPLPLFRVYVVTGHGLNWKTAAASAARWSAESCRPRPGGPGGLSVGSAGGRATVLVWMPSSEYARRSQAPPTQVFFGRTRRAASRKLLLCTTCGTLLQPSLANRQSAPDSQSPSPLYISYTYKPYPYYCYYCYYCYHYFYHFRPNTTL